MYSKRESVCVRKERKKEKKKGNVGIEVAKLRLSVCEREGESLRKGGGGNKQLNGLLVSEDRFHN